MLIYLCILLSAWFVIWWLNWNHLKELVGAIAYVLVVDEDDETEEGERMVHEKRCDACGNVWFDLDSESKICPKCGKELVNE